MSPEDRVGELIEEHLYLSADDIQPDLELEEAVDYQDLLQMILAAEEEFHIELNDEEVQSLETIGELYDLILERIRE